VIIEGKDGRFRGYLQNNASEEQFVVHQFIAEDLGDIFEKAQDIYPIERGYSIRFCGE